MNINETWLQFTKRIWGCEISDDAAEALLWTCTAFPCIAAKDVAIQLRKAKQASGGCFSIAMKQAEEAMSKACKEMNDMND